MVFNVFFISYIIFVKRFSKVLEDLDFLHFSFSLNSFLRIHLSLFSRNNRKEEKKHQTIF